MRHFICGLLMATLVTSSSMPGWTAPAETTASRPAAAAAPPLAIEELEGQLVRDEAYRRDGAITNMRTCLAIADDDAATPLWIEEFGGSVDPDEWDERDDAALAGELERRRHEFRDEDGFGTLLACAQIVAAWHGTLPARRAGPAVDDGRVEHGAVVIDLATADGTRSPIRPEPLVRLLSSNGLLPPYAFGGVVVRNARINGPLVLYNLHLNHALMFVNTEFRGGDYDRGFLGEEPIRNTSVAIQQSRFGHHFGIMSSRLCGDLRIRDSSFSETVLFAEVEQRAAGCEPLSKISNFHIQGSQFHQ